MASDFMTAPAVFAVHNVYHIMVPVNCETLMWVKVGDKCYYDDSNGILRSAVTVHRMIVPADELNEAKKYTVCYRKVIKREPYFTKTEDVCEMEYDFMPVEKDRMVAYHIADAHNMVDAPVAAAKKFEDSYGKLDFLILNGDVIEHSGSIKNFYNVYKIASEITVGHIPVVFSRGNHDTRGIFAENIAEYTPCENGKSYFSFRLGSLWGVVLDCGEDKPDTSIEYGNTICCADLRQKETQFIKELIADAEYNHAEVKHKIVVVHMPFTRKNKPPFNIEELLRVG